MNKNEFIQRLEKGLAGVSPDERVAAVQYYTEYFDDAGPEREEDVLSELGDPVKLAADIATITLEMEKAEEEGYEPQPEAQPAESQAPQAAQPEQAQQPAQPVAGAPVPVQQQAPQGGYAPQQQTYPPQNYQLPGGYVPRAYTAGQAVARGVSIAALVLLILFSPAIFGLLVAAFVILLVPVIVGVAFVAAGIFTIGLSSLLFPVTFGSGLAFVGFGIAFAGLGLLLCYAGIRFLVWSVPATVRGFTSLIRTLLMGGKNG